MTSKYRPKRRQNPPLRAVAKAAPESGRGFAASKGVFLPRAKAVGRSSTSRLFTPPENRCAAESFCDRKRETGFMWCRFHCARARSLGVEPLADPS